MKTIMGDLNINDLLSVDSVTLKFLYIIEKSYLPGIELKAKNGSHTSGKISDIIESLKMKRTFLKFHRMADRAYQLDLELFDDQLPRILSEIAKIFYMGEGTTIPEIVGILNSTNPCNYDQSLGHLFYEYKIKKFLSGSALLTDSDYSGIKQTEEFKDYLFNNTRLDSPSSTRHGYGQIYKEGKNRLFNLNLQIRFK
ncbi:MAG: HpaII family restriction endonuclease [Candidatus Omnitrophica bacterium]|nr:HpaII family restriction endonuclease [Candidatus Omnitrophota bacterium]